MNASVSAVQVCDRDYTSSCRNQDVLKAKCGSISSRQVITRRQLVTVAARRLSDRVETQLIWSVIWSKIAATTTWRWGEKNRGVSSNRRHWSRCMYACHTGSCGIALVRKPSSKAEGQLFTLCWFPWPAMQNTYVTTMTMTIIVWECYLTAVIIINRPCNLLRM